MLQTYSTEFRQIMSLFKSNEYKEEFEGYLKTTKDNGVPEKARYFFFIARKVFLGSQEEVRKFNYFMEMNHPTILNLLYWGKKIVLPQITNEDKEYIWTDI